MTICIRKRFCYQIAFPRSIWLCWQCHWMYKACLLIRKGDVPLKQWLSNAHPLWTLTLHHIHVYTEERPEIRGNPNTIQASWVEKHSWCCFSLKSALSSRAGVTGASVHTAKVLTDLPWLWVSHNEGGISWGGCSWSPCGGCSVVFQFSNRYLPGR
jgi:hypothetical protein